MAALGATGLGVGGSNPDADDLQMSDLGSGEMETEEQLRKCLYLQLKAYVCFGQ